MNDLETIRIQRRIVDLYGMMVMYQSLKNPTYNTIVNVGSFTGRYSNVYAKLFSNVISFDPSTHDLINKHKSLNETFINKALYSEKTELEFYQFPVPGYDSITKDFLEWNADILEKYQPTVTKIETYTLDEFNFQNIDYIKIDAEGVDGHVILGAQDTIKRCRPVIQVETMNDCQEAIDFLLHNNYARFDDNSIFLEYGRHRDDVWVPQEKL
jgi:FkbM family methyltransferase